MYGDATQELKPAAVHVLTVMAMLTRGLPARTVVIADACGWPPRTVRYYLAAAESAGLVHRPYGPKSGWKLARVS